MTASEAQKTESQRARDADQAAPREAGFSKLEDALHPRLPQYTVGEVQQAIEAIQLLIRVRDRCRDQGLIDW